MIAGPALRPAAYAIDAVLQELAFVLGPPLLALLVVLASPRVALFAAAGAGGVGAGSFAALRPLVAMRRRAAPAERCGPVACAACC